MIISVVKITDIYRAFTECQRLMWALYTSSLPGLVRSLWDRLYSLPLLRDEETQAKSVHKICANWQDQEGTESRFKLGQMELNLYVPMHHTRSRKDVFLNPMTCMFAYMCVCVWVLVREDIWLAHGRMFSNLPAVLPSITATAHTLKLGPPGPGLGRSFSVNLVLRRARAPKSKGMSRRARGIVSLFLSFPRPLGPFWDTGPRKSRGWGTEPHGWLWVICQGSSCEVPHLSSLSLPVNKPDQLARNKCMKLILRKKQNGVPWWAVDQLCH